MYCVLYLICLNIRIVRERNIMMHMPIYFYVLIEVELLYVFISYSFCQNYIMFIKNNY